MEIVSSYGAEIRKLNKPLCTTLDIYRKAVAWLIPVYEKEWETLEGQPDKNRRFNLAEHLVHETKKNKALYSFDSAFPKMPSYLRRSVIRHAIGSVSSYRGRMKLWEQGKLSGKPRLNAENHEMTVFYHKFGALLEHFGVPIQRLFQCSSKLENSRFFRSLVASA